MEPLGQEGKKKFMLIEGLHVFGKRESLSVRLSVWEKTEARAHLESIRIKATITINGPIASVLVGYAHVFFFISRFFSANTTCTSNKNRGSF